MEGAGFVTGCDGEPDTVSKISSFMAHGDGVNAVQIGPKSGQLIATGGEDGKINLWRIGRPSVILGIKASKSPVKCIAFDPEENIIACGTLSGSIQFFALNAHGKMIGRLSGHRAECTTISFHPLGNMVVSGSVDSNVKLWDRRSKSCLWTLMGHTGTITCAQFSPDGRWVATGSEDKTIRLWDLQTGKTLNEFSAHRGTISTLKFHPSEFWLASSSADGTVKYFDLETFSLVGSTPSERGSAIRSIEFLAPPLDSRHSDQQQFKLVSCSDESVKVWRWQPCRCEFQEHIPWGTVVDTYVAPDKNGDHRLVACCFKGRSMISVWSVNMSKMTARKAKLAKKPVNHRHHSEGKSREECDSHIKRDEGVRSQKKCPERVARGLIPKKEEEEEGRRRPARKKLYHNKKSGNNDSDSDNESVDDLRDEINNEEAKNQEQEKEQDNGTDYEEDFDEIEEEIETDSDIDMAPESPTTHQSERPYTARNSSESKEEKMQTRTPPKTAHHISKATKTKTNSKTKANQDDVGKKHSRKPAKIEKKGGGIVPKLVRGEKKARECLHEKHSTNSKENSRQVIASLGERDSPLELSISEFMRDTKHGMTKMIPSKTVRTEMKVQISQDLWKGHSKFMTVMQERIDEVEYILSMWQVGDTVRALEYSETVGNASVVYDFLRYANLRNGQTANLEICAAALPVLVNLAESQFEDHIKMSLSSGKFLFDSFSGLVQTTLEQHSKSKKQNARNSVDVSREERIEKCQRCEKGFHGLMEALDRLVESPSASVSSCTRRDATNLHAKLSKLFL